MRTLWTRFLILILTLGALASAGVAQDAGEAAQEDRDRKTSTITFYGHVFGHGITQPMPANTQYPEGEENYGIGGGNECAGPAPSCEDEGTNMLVLYSTAGFVQIADRTEFEEKGRYAALHNEHGNTKDIILDKTQSIQTNVYLSVDAHAMFVGVLGQETDCNLPDPRDLGCPLPYWGWDPGVFPDFYIKASLYHATLGEYASSASDQPQIQSAYDSGQMTLVAEGTLYTPLVTNGIPGNPNVHEYVVDLGAPQVDRIPKEDDIFIVYRFYHETSGVQWNNNAFRIWSGEFFPVRFTLPVKNAFDVEKVVPQFIHERLAILATLNTPWGSYDINPEATKLTVLDANGNEVTPTRIEALADYKVAHGAHYKPVNVTFIWDYRADNLPPGEYTAQVEGGNHQGSASAGCSATFVIGPGGRPESVQPGVCGQQTQEVFQNQQGVEDGRPAASGGGNLLAGFPDRLL